MSILTSFSSHLLSAGDATPGLDPQYKRDMDALERVQQRVTWKRLRGIVFMLTHSKDKDSFFKAVSSHRTRDSGHKLKHRKQLFTKRVTYHRSCRVVVGSWAMEIFKSYQDTHSGHVTLFRWYSLTR